MGTCASTMTAKQPVRMAHNRAYEEVYPPQPTVKQRFRRLVDPYTNLRWTDIGIMRWLPTYNREKFVGDINAALVVAVILVPQGMAYAVLSGGWTGDHVDVGRSEGCAGAGDGADLCSPGLNSTIVGSRTESESAVTIIIMDGIRVWFAFAAVGDQFARPRLQGSTTSQFKVSHPDHTHVLPT